MTIEQLRKKARYGHKSYLHWVSKDGEFCWAPYGKAGVKDAILAVGTKGRFYWLDGSGNSNIARKFSYMIHLWRCA